MVYRVAYSYLKNRPDAEDALQETFLRLIRGRVCFTDETHEKAWLVRTVSNVCRDLLKAKARQHEPLDDHAELAAPEQGENALLAAVLALPEKYRIVLYLYGVEGYSVREIAALLRRPPNTIKTRLSRAREMLKTEWEA
jgi:RNA polymerase sigma-70 factor (ECF subfamily)